MTLTSLVPLPYRILALVVLAIALYAAGVVHGMKLGEADLDRWRLAQQKETIEAQQAAVAKTRAMQAQKDGALHDAEERAKRNRADAARATAAAASLRDQLADAQRNLPHASDRSIRDYAATLSAVFAECVDRYRAMGEAATGHASDSLTLQQSWPK